jgi:hypothetical protein
MAPAVAWPQALFSSSGGSFAQHGGGRRARSPADWPGSLGPLASPYASWQNCAQPDAVRAFSPAPGSSPAAKVLVKRLVCIEDLGDVEVLFTDKTGTLTEAGSASCGRSATSERPTVTVIRPDRDHQGPPPRSAASSVST